MKDKFIKKLIEVDNNIWKDFKYVAKYYGRELPFVLNEALKEYTKNKMKDIERSNEN